MMIAGITEQDLIDALLSEYPVLQAYDPKVHMSKEAAAELWGVDPKTAFMRLDRMAKDGKLTRIEAQNPVSKRPMVVFGAVSKQD
jgi:hypothetical protein